MSQLFYHALAVPEVKKLNEYITDSFYKLRLQKPGILINQTCYDVKKQHINHTHDSD